MIFYRRIARQHFPLAGAAFIWLAAFLILRRPQMMDKIWVFLEALLAIWIAAGIMGPLREVRFRWPRLVPLASILIGLAMILPLVLAVQTLSSLPTVWAIRSPVENTAQWVRGRLQNGDLIIIDAPYDAQFWYYARLDGVSAKRFDQRLPFQRLFVVVSLSNQQTVDSVLHDRGPDPTQVNEATAKLVLNFGNLDTYEVLHR